MKAGIHEETISKGFTNIPAYDYHGGSSSIVLNAIPYNGIDPTLREERSIGEDITYGYGIDGSLSIINTGLEYYMDNEEHRIGLDASVLDVGAAAGVYVGEDTFIGAKAMANLADVSINYSHEESGFGFGGGVGLGLGAKIGFEDTGDGLKFYCGAKLGVGFDLSINLPKFW